MSIELLESIWTLFWICITIAGLVGFGTAILCVSRFVYDVYYSQINEKQRRCSPHKFVWKKICINCGFEEG